MGVPETVELFVGGGITKSYLASPAGRRGPGVCVLHESWGLVGFVKEVCDKLSHENYFAIAPDLYHTSASYDPKVADTLLKSLKVPQVEQEVGAALKAIVDRPGYAGDKFALLGFGIGGQLALHAASKRDDIAACIVFYPYLAGLALELAELKAPVLAFFGGQDEVLGPGAGPQLEADLKAAGKSVELHVYEQAKHAFFNQKRKDVFDLAAAHDAWEKTLAFLRRHLRGARTGGWLRSLLPAR